MIIVLIAIVFNLIVYTLYETATRVEQPRIIEPTKVLETWTWDKEVQSWGTVVLSKQTVVVSSTTDKWHEEVNQEQTEPVLKPLTVNAWYDGETEYERVRNQIIKLRISYEIAEHITREAYTNTSWAKQFVRAIIWVSNAEWSMFKRGMYNNYLWVMACGGWECHLRHYETVQLAITHRREMYNKNKRYVRTTPELWLKWNYCASACSYRVQNYNKWVYLLNI